MVVRSAQARRSATGVKRLRGAERRRLLLDAARRVVKADGVPAVTMDRVATEASVSKALVYQHFANTSEILVALLSEELGRVDPAVEGNIAATTFEARVREAAKVFMAAMASRDSVLHELVLQAPAEPALEAEVLAYRTRNIAFWSALVRETHPLSVTESELLAAMLLAGYDGIAIYWWRHDCPLDTAVDIFTDGVLGAVERVVRSR